MSDVVITTASGVDRKAEKLRPYFGADLRTTDDYWYCTDVEDGLGSEPGYARIVIPNSAGVRDESCFSVAYNPDGPASVIKHGSQVAVKRWYHDGTRDRVAIVWAGRVSNIKPQVEDDSLIVTALDARDRLKDIRMIGRYVATFTAAHNWLGIAYQQGWHSHFNPGGRPNCMMSPGGSYVFAPSPDWGLGVDQAPANTDTELKTRAGYWTLARIMAHLRTFYAYETPTDAAAAFVRGESSISSPYYGGAAVAFPMLQRFPNWVSWPVGFGSELDSYAEGNFDDAVGQNNENIGLARKGRDMVFKAHAFVGDGGEQGIFDMIFAAAGGWSWTLAYDENVGDGYNSISNILQAKPTRWYNAPASVDLPIAVGGAAESVLNTPAITGSDYEEASRTTVTRAWGMGSLIKIERRVSTTAGTLLPAWTAADEAAFLAEVVTQGGGSLANKASFDRAAAMYWWVYTTWMLAPSFDFTNGTTESGRGVGSGGLTTPASLTRPVWPMLLSHVQQGNAANDIVPYPVRVELSDDSGSTWELGTEGDGLEVWDDGLIYLPGLRDVVAATDGNTTGSWRFTSGQWGLSGSSLAAAANDLRVTLAIPCDHRLEYAVRTFLASGSTAPSIAVVDDSPDVEKLDPEFQRTIVADMNGLYEAWLRYGSWPVPEMLTGATQASDKISRHDSLAIRTDENALISHVHRMLIDKFTLTVSGGWTIGGTFTTQIAPGTAIGSLTPRGGADGRKPFVVRRVIGRRRFQSERDKDRAGNPVWKNSTILLPI